jgi:hypothetical protein
VLLRAMQGLVLAEAELKIVSTRQGAEPGGGRGKAGE